MTVVPGKYLVLQPFRWNILTLILSIALQNVFQGGAKSIAKLHLVDYQRILDEFGEGDNIEKYKSCFSMSNFISDLLLNVQERYEDADREAMLEVI